MHLLETAQGPEVTDLFEQFADVAPPKAASASISSNLAARQAITNPSETHEARYRFNLVPAIASAISRHTGVLEPSITRAYASTMCALFFLLAWLCLHMMLKWALRAINSKELTKFQINGQVQDILSKIGHEEKIMLTYIIEGHRIVENFVNVLNN